MRVVAPRVERAARSIATLWYQPAAIVRQVLAFVILKGVRTLVVELLPTWPLALPPHTYSEPSSLMAMTCERPAGIAFQRDVPSFVKVFGIPCPRSPSAPSC